MGWIAEHWKEGRRDAAWLGLLTRRATYLQAGFLAFFGAAVALVGLVSMVLDSGPRGAPQRQEEEIWADVFLLLGGFTIMAWGMTFAAVLGVGRALQRQIDDLKRRLDQQGQGNKPPDDAADV